LINRSSTYHELLHDIETILSNDDLFYGHGTDNAMDESMAIIMHLLQSHDPMKEDQLKASIEVGLRKKAKEILYQRIINLKPLPYITNEAYFCETNFFIDERALIPRSPIAELIKKQFQPWVNLSSINRVLEIGTGSGCIALSIAKAYPNIEVVATDISERALEVADKNVSQLGLENNVDIIHSDLFSKVMGTFDLIISNPPYVPKEVMSNLPSEYRHEPELALAAGHNGLDFISRILHDAHPFLSENGILIIEAGVASENMEKEFNIPFIWMEFDKGGEGVAMIEAKHLKRIS
jgi:ribosomal protein L3 glutamine methyltransferase